MKNENNKWQYPIPNRIWMAPTIMASTMVFRHPSLSPRLSPLPFSSTSTTGIHHHRHNIHRNRNHLLLQIILKSYNNKNGSNTPPETECPVPLDQQPINEYQNLSTSFPFSWAASDIVEFSSRLFVTGSSFALFIGLPVAWFGSVGNQSDPLKTGLVAVCSGILVVSLAVLRMYLGWAYVGNRLLSATVEYEETGWYDGQYLATRFTAPYSTRILLVQDRFNLKSIWVKTAEILARDRLLGSFSVKPVLSRLKYTLLTLAASLLVCVLVLFNIEEQKSSNVATEAGGRAIPGVYNDDSARLFEPDAFCGEPGGL